MTVRTHRFPVGLGPHAVEVRNPTGSVAVEAVEDCAEYVVEIHPLDRLAEEAVDKVDLFLVGSRLRVHVSQRRLLRPPRFAIRVTVPPATAARVAVASADTDLRGPLGACELTGASGVVAVEQCTELQLRTASGDARIGTVAGRATVGTASGDLRIGLAEDGLELRTASGDIAVESAAGTVNLGTASGDVRVDAMGAGRLQLKTVSGDAEIGVVPGLRVWLDLSSVSGRMESQLDDDDAGGDGPAQLTLSMRSVSGHLQIRRAALA